MFQVRFDTRSKSLTSVRPSSTPSRASTTDVESPATARSGAESQGHADSFTVAHSPDLAEVPSDGFTSHTSPDYAGFASASLQAAACRSRGMLNASHSSPYINAVSNRIQSAGINGGVPLWTGAVHPSEVAPIAADQHGNGALQQACLLRYFIEEISPWFDLCDEHRHFQRHVPRRARQCPPLMNAIFAAAARHLFRVPKYRTHRGIAYLGQLLPDLTVHTGFEYMLLCIPALREFPQTQSGEYRESLVVAALILRQFEEMDSESDTQNAMASLGDGSSGSGPVNFLDIAQAVLKVVPHDPLVSTSDLMKAVHWVLVRQEIYFAFSRDSAPQFTFYPEQEQEASFANKMVLHASRVALWRWGDKSLQEWERLKVRERELEQECHNHIMPILKRDADRSLGETLPLTWYESDEEVTAIQHFLLAKTVLVAENPNLHSEPGDSRKAYRDAEHEVRSTVLEICSLAIYHLRAPPNLATAMLAITHYGDFFRDRWERAELARVLEECRNRHAWPVEKAYQSLQAGQDD